MFESDHALVSWASSVFRDGGVARTLPIFGTGIVPESLQFMHRVCGNSDAVIGVDVLRCSSILPRPPLEILGVGMLRQNFAEETPFADAERCPAGSDER